MGLLKNEIAEAGGYDPSAEAPQDDLGQLLQNLPRADSSQPRALIHDPDKFKAGKFAGKYSNTQFDPIFSEVEDKYGLPKGALKPIAFLESAFRDDIINGTTKSSTGATGMMQFMPKTAKRYGVTDPTDPVQAIDGAGKYMATLLARYDGNMSLAYAAYHAGEGNVNNLLADKPNEVGPLTKTYAKRALDLYLANTPKDEAPQPESPMVPESAEALRFRKQGGFTHTPFDPAKRALEQLAQSPLDSAVVKDKFGRTRSLTSTEKHDLDYYSATIPGWSMMTDAGRLKVIQQQEALGASVRKEGAAKASWNDPDKIKNFIDGYTATGRDPAEAAKKLSEYKAQDLNLDDVLAGNFDKAAGIVPNRPLPAHSTSAFAQEHQYLSAFERNGLSMVSGIVKLADLVAGPDDSVIKSQKTGKPIEDLTPYKSELAAELDAKAAQYLSATDAKPMGAVNWSDPVEASDYLAVKFFGALPSTIMSAALYNAPGAVQAAYLTFMGATTTGNQAQQLYELGVPKNDAMLAGSWAGIVEAGSEKIGLDLLGASVNKFITKQVLDTAVKKAAGLGLTVIANQLPEAGEEAFSQAVGDNVSNWVAAKLAGDKINPALRRDLENTPFMEGTGEAALGGALGGTGAAMAAGVERLGQNSYLNDLQSGVNRLINTDSHTQLDDATFSQVLDSARYLHAQRPGAIDIGKLEREDTRRLQARGDAALEALNSPAQELEPDQIFKLAEIAATSAPLNVNSVANDFSNQVPDSLRAIDTEKLPKAKPEEVPLDQLTRYHELLKTGSTLPMDTAFVKDVERRLGPEVAELLNKSVTQPFNLGFDERRKVAEILNPKRNLSGVSDEALTAMASEVVMPADHRAAITAEQQKRGLIPSPVSAQENTPTVPGSGLVKATIEQPPPSTEYAASLVTLSQNPSGTHVVSGPLESLNSIQQTLREQGIRSMKAINTGDATVLQVAKSAPAESVQAAIDQHQPSTIQMLPDLVRPTTTERAQNGQVQEGQAPTETVIPDNVKSKTRAADLKTLEEGVNRDVMRMAMNASPGSREAKLRPYRLVEVAETALPVTVPTATKLGVRLIAKAFGKRVAYIADANGQELTFHGVYGGDSGGSLNTIYLDAKGSPKLTRVVGHEILHALRTQAPDIYSSLEDAIAPLLDTRNAPPASESRDGKAWGEKGSHLREENIADLIGDEMVKPSFWLQMTSKLAHNVAQKVLGSALDKLDRVVAAFTGQPLSRETTQTFKQARNAVVTAMKEYKARVKSGEIQGAEAEPLYHKKLASDNGHKRVGSTGRYVGAPDWIGSSPQQLAVLRKKLRSLALEGAAGKLWYERSSKAILDFVAGDKTEAERVVGLIAIYSQGTEVSVNLGFALEAYYQWKAGLPIDSGRFPVEQTRKAEAWLNRGKDWGGIKTNNFYVDLMEEIDPNKVDPDHATMDTWMALAFDYGKKVLDQGPQYGFAKREILALAKELGWKPHQAQAAIWTAIKHRIEATERVRRTQEIAKGILVRDAKGNLVFGKDGDGNSREYEHFRLAHKLGMALPLDPKDIQPNDFADELAARTVQISWEATPSVTGGDLPGIHSATTAQKFEYLTSVSKVLYKDGVDQIADMINLHSLPTVFGYSAWEGAIGAGAQSFIPVPITGSKAARAVLPVAKDLLGLYSAIKGLVLKQDAVVWHTPIYHDSAVRHNGFELSGTRALTEEEITALYQAIFDKFGTWELAPGYTLSGAHVLNFTDLSNKEFQKGMQEVVDQLHNANPDFLGGVIVTKAFRSEGDYIFNDWKEKPNGESYTSRISESGRPGLQARAESLRAGVEAVNRQFAEKYGWDKPSPAYSKIKAAIGNSGAFSNSTGDIRYKAKELTEDQGRQLVAKWTAFAHHMEDNLYRYPRSEAEDLKTITKEVSGGRATVGEVTGWFDNIPADRKVFRIETPKASKIGVNTTQDSFMTQEGKDVWINVASLTEGSGGSLIYSIVGNYAYNNGLRFIADPEGVSVSGQTRRLINMLSLATKFNNTDFLKPHQRQLNNLKDLGFDWRQGDFVYNLHHMLVSAYNSVLSYVPEMENVDYNFETGVFTKDGAAFTDEDFDAEASKIHGTLTAGAPGRGTLKTGAVIGSLLRQVDGSGLPQSGLGSAEDLRSGVRGILYSRKTSWYYSQLAKAFDEQPDRIFNQPAKQLAIWLQSNASKLGIKQDEIQWSGITDWLNLQGKTKVSKAEVLDYLNQNGVMVQDVTLKEPDDIEGLFRRDFTAYGYDLEYDAFLGQFNLTKSTEGYPVEVDYDELPQDLQDMLSEVPGATQYGKEFRNGTTLLDGPQTDYTELLLTLPDRRKEALVKENKALTLDIFRAQDEASIAPLQKRLSDNQLEIALRNASNSYTSSHFENVTNPLAHVRFNTRKTGSDKVLFLEEIQSDWAQQGRKEAFAPPLSEAGFRDWYNGLALKEDTPFDELSPTQKTLMQSTYTSSQTRNKVPSAPFVQDTKAWTALVLKRMIAYAVDNGFTHVAWTSGEQQVERYDLSKQISALRVRRSEGPTPYAIVAELHNGKPYEIGQASAAELPNLVGKDMAEKILAQTEDYHEYRGLDLKIGGEGMHAFYDGILPQVASSLLKKLGGGPLETINLSTKIYTRVHDVIKDQITIENTDTGAVVAGPFTGPSQLEDSQAWYDANEPILKTPQQGFAITPAMKAAVEKGLPLFSRKTETLTGSRFALPLEAATDATIRRMQNDQLRWKQQVQAIRDRGGIINDSNDVYQAMERMVARAMNTTLDFYRAEVEPTLKAMHKAGITLDELGEYLYAAHAKERNREMAKLNPAYANTTYTDVGGSGMSDQEADIILARFRARPDYAEINRFANAFRDWADQSLSMLVNGGLVSQAQAAAMRAKYPNYVPLRGFQDEGEIGEMTGLGGGFSTGKRVIRRALGRSSRAGNPAIYIIHNAAEAILSQAKSEVGQYLEQLIQDNPDPALWRINQPHKEPVYIDNGNGGTVGKRDMGYDPDNEVRFIRNGKEVRIQLMDPLLARAYNNRGSSEVGDIVRASSVINGFLRQMWTQKNPVFPLKNVLRDVPAAMVYATGEHGFGLAATMIKDIPGAWWAMLRFSMGKDPSAKMAPWITEYRAAGGGTGFRMVGDIQNTMDRIAKIEKQLGELSVWQAINQGKPLTAAQRMVWKTYNNIVFDFIEHINEAFENMTRLALFKAARERGLSIAEAARLSKNATVNFNRKGELTPSVNGLYLFFNAGVQNIAKDAHTLFESKHRGQARAVMAAYATLGFALAMMSGGDDDEEDKKSLDNEEAHIRSIRFHIGDTAISIPLSYGVLGFSYYLGRTAAKLVQGEDITTQSIRLASALFSHITPLNPIPNAERVDLKNATVALTPTALSLPMQAVLNRNSWGQDMMPDYRESDPDAYKAFRGTRDSVYTQLSAFMNENTGGDKFTPGFLDISPETIKGAVHFAFGGSGKFVADTITTTEDLLEGDPNINQVPFVNSFARKLDVTDYRARFYREASKAKDDLELYNKYGKSGNMDKASELAERAMFGSGANQMWEQMSYLRDQELSVSGDKTLSVTERKRLIADIRAQQIALSNQFHQWIRPSAGQSIH